MIRLSTILILGVAISCINVFGQQVVSDLFQIQTNDESYPNISPYLNNYVPLELDEEVLKNIISRNEEIIQLNIPVSDDNSVDVMLKQFDVFSSDFQSSEINNNGLNKINYTKGVYMRGKIVGDEQSTATISFFGDRVMGVISSSKFQLVLGRVALEEETFEKTITDYVLYNENDLTISNNFGCGAKDIPFDSYAANNGVSEKTSAGKIVRVQIECDYETYIDNGSNSANVMNFVSGFFAVVSTIYNNESINTQISDIQIWSTPDSYPITSANDALFAFGQAKQDNVNGDVAHLISTGSSNLGGSSWVDKLCSSYNPSNHSGPYSYSNVYNTYAQLPVYSWTVNAFAHEMGHIIGSRHTHACVWGPNNDAQIDDCAPYDDYVDNDPIVNESAMCFNSNSPILPSSGTVMSYCQLVGGVGVNFINGFGLEPGNVLRSEISNASCLSSTVGDVPCNATTYNVVNECNTSFYTNAGATDSGEGTPGCGTYMGGDVWFKVQAPQSGKLVFKTEAADLTNVGMSIYSSSCNTLVLMDCKNTDGLGGDMPIVTREGLTPNEDIYIRIWDNNNDEVGTFGLCVFEPNYCMAQGATPDEWIAEVSFNTIEHASGDNDGYADYTATHVTTLEKGGAYPFTLTPGYSGAAWQEYFKIWIDYNQDFDFDDAGELVYDPEAIANFAVSGTINIPTDVPLGATRMRIAMRYVIAPNECGIFNYGEVEDYTVIIVDPIGGGTGSDSSTTSNDSTSVAACPDMSFTQADGTFTAASVYEGGIIDASNTVIAVGTIRFDAVDEVILAAEGAEGFHVIPTTVGEFIANVGDGCGGVYKMEDEVIEESIINKTDLKLNAYPNPTRGLTTIEFETSKDSEVSVAIYNLQGQEIMSLYNEVVFANQNNQVQLDAQSLNKGLYIVQMMSSDGERQILKLSVQ